MRVLRQITEEAVSKIPAEEELSLSRACSAINNTSGYGIFSTLYENCLLFFAELMDIFFNYKDRILQFYSPPLVSRYTLPLCVLPLACHGRHPVQVAGEKLPSETVEL